MMIDLATNRHPSTVVAQLIDGVIFPHTADALTRRIGVHFVAEWQHLCDETLGWYEHTSDWDWWVRIETYDGLIIDPGCGSSIDREWATLDPTLYSEAHDTYNTCRVVFYAGDPYDGDEPDDNEKAAMAKYGTRTENQDIIEVVWDIPLSDIASIHVGYDT